MIKISIEIDSEYEDLTDEIFELTQDLQKSIQENEELEIYDIKIPEVQSESCSKGTFLDWGNLIIPAVLSPAVTIVLIKTIHIWINANKEKAIAKSVKLNFQKKQYELNGYNDEEVTRIIQEIKKGE